jgi:hypothetical protein
MVRSQTAFSILDEAAAAIGGWTALQSIRCVHWDSDGQDWEPWQAYEAWRPPSRFRRLLVASSISRRSAHLSHFTACPQTS